MKYNFNWSAVTGGAPYITISSLGIAFNSVSIEKLQMPKKIIIGFDEDNCAIGIKAYENEHSIKPFEFASRIKNNWIRIGCKDFIKYLQSITDLNFTVSKKYVAKFDSEEKVLTVELLDNSEEEDNNK